MMTLEVRLLSTANRDGHDGPVGSLSAASAGHLGLHLVKSKRAGLGQ